MTSRRSLIVGGLALAAGLLAPRVDGQPRRPTITVYRDPT
jgi:hypothetical protein